MSRLRLGLGALLVFGAMLPETIVIPVVRSFVLQRWPAHEWLMHAFLAANLAGAVVGGPVLAVRAERLGRRRLTAAVASSLSGALLLVSAATPPIALLLVSRFLQGAVYIAAVSILMGTIRRATGGGASMGVVGAAVIFSIAAGFPLGGALGNVSTELPIYVGGVVGIVTGMLAIFVLPVTTDAEPSRLSFRELLTQVPALRAPTLVVSIERFAVGALIVPLQVFGRDVLEVDKAVVNRWFTVLMVAFALATQPMTKLGDRVSRWTLVAFGAAAYASTYLLIGFVPVDAIVVLMLVAGLGSAAVYGPSLGLAAAAVPDNARSSAMAVLNASGTLGMFLGSVLAGTVSGGLLAAGWDRRPAYVAVFVTAGLIQAVSVVIAWRRRQVRQ